MADARIHRGDQIEHQEPDPEGLQHQYFKPRELPESNWNKYTIQLTHEGKAYTKHMEEIPPATIINNYIRVFQKGHLKKINKCNSRHSFLGYIYNWLLKVFF